MSKKLQKMASLLYNIENMELPPQDNEMDKESLLNNRKLLLRKLHLAELRLSARDAEIDYLHNLLDSKTSVSSPKEKKSRKGPPYLFQQQYSPRNSEVRSSEQHPLSGLDSLGIVADQMLSDPEFDSTTNRAVLSNEKRLRSRLDDRRSQRSIDSAATLLAMPQLMVPTRKGERHFMFIYSANLLYIAEQQQSSPEQFFQQHIPKKPRSTYTRWTEAEDALLRKAVKKYGHSNWEACSKDVHGRSNIQCRNRWIRHLEHRIVEEEEPCNARQSPSIASLLNNSHDDEHYNYSPKYDASSSTYHPTYRPPSPMATPKGGKRRPSEPNKW